MTANRQPTLAEAAPVWGRVALLSFGGPAGQIAVMHKIIVEEKGWIGEAQFLHALNYCMLLPGPEAQQLAIYLGWLLNGTRGGLVAGGLFIVPGIIAIMVLSWIYALFGQVGPVAALFFGLKAAVLAIVLQALVRISGRALKSRALELIALAAFAAIFFLNVPFPLIILAAAAAGYAGHRLGWTGFNAPPAHGEATSETTARPRPNQTLRTTALWLLIWLSPVCVLLATLGPNHIFSQIALFFGHMAIVTFGGAYAVLAYVAQQAVETYGWLKPGEMLDGLGMAETTPGPLIMVLQFIGFMAAFRAPGALSPLLAGTLGGLLATWVTFAPCFLWVFVGAPYVEALRGQRGLNAALSAITAAVVGVILNLALWFALHSTFRQLLPLRLFSLGFDAPVLASVNVWALVLSLAAIFAVFRLHLSMLKVLALSALAGLALHVAGLN